MAKKIVAPKMKALIMEMSPKDMKSDKAMTKKIVKKTASNKITKKKIAK